MKAYFWSLFSVLVCFSIAAAANAQTRAFGAKTLILDDGSGNTITIQTPASGWAGNIAFQLPIPPTGNPLAGFVHIGTSSGQILEWNPTDGVQGAWDALNGATGNDGWVLAWNNSTNLPEWRATAGGGLAHISENYNNSAAPYSAGSAGEQLLATGTDAAISIALQPKGTGALEAQIADGTATGGNLRGTKAVDWQMSRTANTQVASGGFATVSGGVNNAASNTFATVSGGFTNTASGTYATVSGGYTNTGSTSYATVSGGFTNTASGNYATVSGGYTNTASTSYATVSGGSSNTASSSYATVSGGYTNAASSSYATVSGGSTNSASDINATVSGGFNNTASNIASTVSGGSSNTASSTYATVSGGGSNIASGGVATVSGGEGNTASGNYSTIAGGELLTLSGHDDFGFLSNNNNNNTPMWIAANNTTVFGNTDLWLADNDNTARALYFYAPYNTIGTFPNGDKYVGFKAGAVSTSVIWTLPLADGTSGQALTTNGTGTLSWGAAGLSHITESYNNTVAPYSAGNAGEQLLASGTDAAISIALQPKGNGALEAQIADNTATGGNARGTNAVDWQMTRGANTQVASGNYATVSGGLFNTTSGNFATVSGGISNTAGGNFAIVSGGDANTSSDDYATVSGGDGNTASGYLTTVSGGYTSIASGYASTVSGGYTNTASGGDATISGGGYNTASGDYATVSGGASNTANGDYATVSGGLDAVASQYGQHAQASGEFVTPGDAQTSVYTERISTSDATPTAMALDGASNQISLATSRAMNFSVHIIAETSGAGAVGAWDIRGAIANNGGTTSIIGTNVTTTYNTPGVWGVPTVTASGTNLVITVTGAATNIHWVARVETAEVTY